ncbi:unnamed protein product, partial [Dicrocoelium dendriticum]
MLTVLAKMHGILPHFPRDGSVHSADEAAAALLVKYAQIFELTVRSCHTPSFTLPTLFIARVIFNPANVPRNSLSLRGHSCPGADNIRPMELLAAVTKPTELLSRFNEQLVPPCERM